MPKFKQIYEEMVSQNKKTFDSFQKIHQEYLKNPSVWQEKLNKEGREVLNIIRRYENRLCSHSENAGFGSYSGKLAEKFWQEIRTHFPKIDFVGIKK